MSTRLLTSGYADPPMKRKANHQPPADEAPRLSGFGLRPDHSEALTIERFDEMLNDDQKELLNRPLDPRAITTRPGGGGAKLSYIEGHYAIRKANEIFGFGNWSYDIVSLTRNDIDDQGNGFYQAMIKLYVCDPATGRPGPPVTEIGNCAYRPGRNGNAQATIDSLDMASKGAVTDAVKRALRCYGDQFGLSLYGDDFTAGDKEPKPETRRPAPATKPVARPQALPDGPGAAKGKQTTNPLPQPREAPQNASKPVKAIPYVPNEDVFNYKRRLDKATADQLDLIAVEIRADKDLTEMDREYLRGTFSERRNYFNGLLDEQEAQHKTGQTGAA